MILRLKNHTLGKPKPSASCLFSSVFRRNSQSHVRTKSDHGDRRGCYEGNAYAEGKREQERLYLYKSKGQHLLTNNRILDAIVCSSDVRTTDTVLEIGPGTGNLTLKLLQAAQNVVAVEVDKRMVEILHKRVAELGFEDKLTVIQKDALKAEFPRFDLVVANIPYNISSPLVAKLVYGSNTFRSATLLLQKEFAQRLLANPGDADFNRLAVNVKLMAHVDFVMDVSKREFVPCPKVDSSVVMIRPKEVTPDVNLQEWLAFTRTCFGKKNKTLGATFKQKKKVMELLKLREWNNSFGLSGDGEEDGSCLATNPSLFKERIIGVLRSSGLEDKRPSKLSHGELLHLLSLFNQAGIFFHDNTMPMWIDPHE
ncbi:PREDICTED: ribosomal RNA small subunit methyltransferase, mitochondrial [Tarenaya hassleriana]|uniref:ribosomal RNA small subunit methyltransferase, mitochondrial n=1 Tax=Tarenaya hassleriana TaxID=28532 RepID=UPI00053C2C03|nr:PREDICTED: ribosomal RNA small subunit methyltransferase, mitochondrial [Tarenaya hassleriana]XP_010557772.1 PREDICTED: ribosomal RNA small subunit methyltransferase, mitochondrial [Tarenaya hassleriana]